MEDAISFVCYFFFDDLKHYLGLVILVLSIGAYRKTDNRRITENHYHVRKEDE